MNILLTGANGLLGGKITKKIIEDTDFGVLAVASSPEKVSEMIEREHVDGTRIHFLSNQDFLKPETELKEVCGAVHLAFARRTRPAADIAASIDFAAAVFHKLADSHIDRVINMSSQGVYGNTEEIRTENTVPAPETQYTMAKYAAEKLFDDIMKECPHHTSLRLDPVAQSQNVIKGLCKSAKQGQINLKGGKQVFSFIDAEDVGSAVTAMLQTGGDWAPVYNVGWNRVRYTLTEMAEIISEAAVYCGYKKPDIHLEESDIALWAGMDSTRFAGDTNWKPVIPFPSTARKCMEEL